MVGQVEDVDDFGDGLPDGGGDADREGEIGEAAALATAAHFEVEDVVDEVEDVDGSAVAGDHRVDVGVEDGLNAGPELRGGGHGQMSGLGDGRGPGCEVFAECATDQSGEPGPGLGGGLAVTESPAEPADRRSDEGEWGRRGACDDQLVMGDQQSLDARQGKEALGQRGTGRRIWTAEVSPAVRLEGAVDEEAAATAINGLGFDPNASGGVDRTETGAHAAASAAAGWVRNRS